MPAVSPGAAMVFAAGLGTRMGALTRDRPKPLLAVGGVTLLDHALALVRAAAVPRVVVNIHAHPGQMRAHLARAAPEALVSEEPLRLETGGGLLAALPLLNANPVFTLNADMIWRGPNPLEILAAGWDAVRMGALLCLVPRDAAQGHAGPGDFHLGAHGRLARRGGSATAPFVFAGAQILDTTALAGRAPGVFSLNSVWDALIADGRLFGVVYTGRWIDVGRPDGLALAEAARAP